MTSTPEVFGVGLFSRRKKLPDPDDRSPESGLKYKDLVLLNQIAEHGADLREPRHVLHYLYFPAFAAATAAAAEIRARQWDCEVREPLPGHPDQWGVACERRDAILDLDFVRDSTDFFEAVSARHGGEYDGWEASI